MIAAERIDSGCSRCASRSAIGGDVRVLDDVGSGSPIDDEDLTAASTRTAASTPTSALRIAISAVTPVAAVTTIC